MGGRERGEKRRTQSRFQRSTSLHLPFSSLLLQPHSPHSPLVLSLPQSSPPPHLQRGCCSDPDSHKSRLQPAEERSEVVRDADRRSVENGGEAEEGERGKWRLGRGSRRRGEREGEVVVGVVGER